MLKCIAHQILEKDPQQPNAPSSTSLVEIGPRFVLTPIRIFEGAFGGVTVYSNPGSLFHPNLTMSFLRGIPMLQNLSHQPRLEK